MPTAWTIQGHEIFEFWRFISQLPTSDKFTSGVVETGEKFISGVVDTTAKFTSGVVNTGD